MVSASPRAVQHNTADVTRGLILKVHETSGKADSVKVTSINVGLIAPLVPATSLESSIRIIELLHRPRKIPKVLQRVVSELDGPLASTPWREAMPPEAGHRDFRLRNRVIRGLDTLQPRGAMNRGEARIDVPLAIALSAARPHLARTRRFRSNQRASQRIERTSP